MRRRRWHGATVTYHLAMGGSGDDSSGSSGQQRQQLPAAATVAAAAVADPAETEKLAKKARRTSLLARA